MPLQSPFKSATANPKLSRASLPPSALSCFSSSITSRAITSREDKLFCLRVRSGNLVRIRRTLINAAGIPVCDLLTKSPVAQSAIWIEIDTSIMVLESLYYYGIESSNRPEILLVAIPMPRSHNCRSFCVTLV